MEFITRFAPSPTGYLHVGNVRTALICYLFAKQNKGKFFLRIDDTDKARSKDEYIEALKTDMEWLGLKADYVFSQSERVKRYNEIKQKLIEDERLYPCFETAEEIEIKRKMLLNRGKPPIYDRSALNLTQDQIKEFMDAGKPVYWRFKLDESKQISWNDHVKNNIIFKAENLSDPVLIRTDGSFTYMLPSAIDDMDYKITHIVRGEDHVSNTAIQIQLFEALDSHIPEFAHLSLMKSADGKISKREGGFEIKDLRDNKNIEKLAVLSLLARLGSSQAVVPRTSLQQLIDNFNIQDCSKSAAIYDFEELARLNAKIVQSFEYEDVKDRPQLKNIDKDFWDKVKSNLSKVEDIQLWWEICNTQINASIEDPEYIKIAASLLPAGTLSENSWQEWTEALKSATGKKGKELYMPLRLALTGLNHGPELKYLLPLIGRETIIARLTK